MLSGSKDIWSASHHVAYEPTTSVRVADVQLAPIDSRRAPVTIFSLVTKIVFYIVKVHEGILQQQDVGIEEKDSADVATAQLQRIVQHLPLDHQYFKINSVPMVGCSIQQFGFSRGGISEVLQVTVWDAAIRAQAEAGLVHAACHKAGVDALSVAGRQAAPLHFNQVKVVGICVR